MIRQLDDEICERLSLAAKEKSEEMGLDISFAIYDENAIPLLYRRFGNAPILSTTLVNQKAYTSALMFMPTEKLRDLCMDGGPLMGLQNNNPDITLVSGGYPLFINGKCVGGIGVGGGRKDEDSIIAGHVLKVFEELIK